MGVQFEPGHGAVRSALPARMSWTWKGFWGDDPVYRFNSQDFFQSGRHKAEERFWVQYIHNAGSFRKPLRSRLSSPGSSYSPAGSTRSSSPGFTSRQEMESEKEEKDDDKILEEF